MSEDEITLDGILPDDLIARIEAIERDKSKTQDDCARKIVDCFLEVSGQLGSDDAARQLFADFKKFSPLMKTPRGRPAGATDPDDDSALLKAWNGAPKGKKVEAVKQWLGDDENGAAWDTLRQRIKRLQRAWRPIEEWKRRIEAKRREREEPEGGH
jgi:hypothetical protein